MGAMVAELERRAAANELLRVTFDHTHLLAWIEVRNHLMHQMPDGSMTLEQIEASVARLAKDGAKLCGTTRRLPGD
jgi:hypothetical protein